MCRRRPLFRMMVPALCLLAAAQVQADDIMFRVEQAGNLDLDAGKLAAVLASDAIEVRVTMAPVIALPGWTGRVGLCGVSSIRDVCIKKRWRSVFLRGRKVVRTGNSLRFHVPAWHWFGLMPYRPAGPVRVSLPPFWPGDLPLNIDTTLAELSGSAGLQLVGDMHLSPPYVGVASWQLLTRRGQEQAAPAWRMTACDPAVTTNPAIEPRMRPHRQAGAYVEWLGTLADNPWWAGQIDGVTQEQGVAPAGAPAWDWRRVTVVRGGETVRYLRVEEPRLLASACPGTTRQEFTWRNDELLGASIRQTPDMAEGDAACDGLLATSRDVLWWGGVVEHGSEAGPAGQKTWDRWRDEDTACRSAVQAVPEVSDLMAAASQWRQAVGQLQPER